MNKKIVGVLTALLIVTMAVPVFADSHMEDKVKITGNVTTVFNAGNYGDNPGAAADLWADDDVLDEDYNDDPDLFPAEKAFYQELGINVAGKVNNNIDFNLAIDTLTNNFTTVEGYNPNGAEGESGTLGNPGALNELLMDSALLTISDDVSTLKLGDINGFHAETYFIDDEDLEGMELTTAMSDSDLRLFIGGNSDVEGTGGDFEESDFYGVTYTKNFDNSFLAGKYYGARNNGNGVNNFAVAGGITLDTITLDGEVVANDADEDMSDLNATGKEGDVLVTANAEFAASETITLNAGVESAGEDFAPVKTHDLEEATNYDLFTVGSEMVVNPDNTVTADYTMVSSGVAGDSEDKSTVELGLDNTMGAYKNNASIAMTTNDEYTDGNDVTVIKVGTEYAMDAATLSAELTNQGADDYDNDLTYLTVGLDQQISENITWDTELAYITGTTSVDSGAVDADANNFETSLTVKF